MRRNAILLAATAAVCGFVAISVRSAPAAEDQVTIKHVPISSTSAVSGQEMYQAYCAACHGRDGKGQGPASRALKMPATDLTKLAHHHDGEFPALDVMNTLGLMRGTTRAHGSEDMPIWGEIFRRSTPTDTLVALRIYNLTRHLETIQDPAPQPARQKAPKPRTYYVTEINAGSGSAMYNAYCASCHGADGTGGGPAAVTLKTAVPDLTLLANKHGGKYPAAHVIDVLGWVASAEAHGSKEMPVWGNLLRGSREDQALVQLRLTNITRYIESLQR